ncbi:MAG: hypothetical protein A3F43_05045 [Gammaproteobacteria bacterium RIFCSPHIGHO2_12_FULL_42_10]|nr:MAG: hypothetical protein A3F43_05045 [Gammaproteobacteria bacterium RIFCSPHIGHO2_12_FULL_42_10]
MRQVPHYLLIGSGRVARHFSFYFEKRHLSFSTWHRNQPIQTLHQRVEQATHILLAISDDAIESFIENTLPATPATLIHFSGSLVTKKAYGAHPLMTFNQQLYDETYYTNIPFVLDHDAPDFADLLPGLSNPHARLHTTLKIKYHALCVLAANFSCILWKKLFTAFENELQLAPELAHPLLRQQMNNLMHDPRTALTGPLVRKDLQTISKHLNILTDDPFCTIYQAFLSLGLHHEHS